MKKIASLILCLFVHYYALANMSDTLYINKNGTVVSKDSARFIRILTKVDSVQYKIEDHFLSGQIQMVAYNNDPNEIIKKGKYVFYDSLGFISDEGEYKMGYKVGVWKYYYFGTRQVKYVHEMKDNHDGYYFKKYDSVSQLVLFEGELDNNKRRNGVYKRYFENDTNIKVIAHFNYGFKEGESFEYYKSGEVKRKEFYIKGKLKKGELFDRNGEKQKYYPAYVPFELGENIFSYLPKKISAYKNGTKPDGLALKLTITKFGNIIKVEIIENPNPQLNEEIIATIYKIKHNKPSKVENQEVDETLIYRFKKVTGEEFNLN